MMMWRKRIVSWMTYQINIMMNLKNNSMVGKYLTINSMNFKINWTNNNWMPSIKTWLWNNLVVLSLTLNFKMLDSEKIGKRQRINKDMRPPSSRHELYLMAIRSEKKLQMRQRGKILKNVLKKSFRGQTLIKIYFGLFFWQIWKQIQQKKGSSHDTFHFTLQSDQFAHAQQSATFKVEEIMKNSEHFENYMTTMANKLNSGESFKSSSKFTANLTFRGGFRLVPLVPRNYSKLFSIGWNYFPL